MEKEKIEQDEKLNKFKIALASIEKDHAANQIKASQDDQMSYMRSELDYCYREMRAMRDYCYQMESCFYSSMNKHLENHLPKLTASGLEKLLKAAGQDKDYNISRPTIYVSASASDKKGLTEYSYSDKKA